MNDSTASALDPAASAPPRDALGVLLAVLAALLHLVAAWLVLVSGLVAPLWALVVGWVLWLGVTFALVRALRARRRTAPLLPLGLLVAWIGLLSLGGAVLGWTA